MDNGENAKNENETYTVEKWSKELAEKYLLVTVVLVVYLVLGVLGNSTVLYIYLRKFKTYSKGRCLIPILAVVDLVSTVTNCSMDLTCNV